MPDNTIDITTRLQDFKDERLRFSVSSRQIQPAMPMSFYLKIMYPYCNFAQIENVFGHTVSFSKLYGGRPFIPEHSLTDQHLNAMDKQGIGLSLNLTNHFYDENSYAESLPLLEQHHKESNSVICTNDQLAWRIKRDFPNYKLSASIIKNLNTLKKSTKHYNYMIWQSFRWIKTMMISFYKPFPTKIASFFSGMPFAPTLVRKEAVTWQSPKRLPVKR
jgi:hypothetical protein